MNSINSYIEHSHLQPFISDKEIDQLVAEAIDYKFFGVCVPPFWVQRAKREIGNSDVQLITVAGFPLGYNLTEIKLEEIKMAIAAGADEVDVVMNISAFKIGMEWVKIELAKCSHLTHKHEKVLKVIIETAYLNEEEIGRACRICMEAGADFVKTSTGFAKEGARVADIRIMRAILPETVGIKASGGIGTYQKAMEMIEAGAERIGTSHGIKIMKELK